jgi:glycosyltransferase involved in cell wall biosynthesis
MNIEGINSRTSFPSIARPGQSMKQRGMCPASADARQVNSMTFSNRNDQDQDPVPLVSIVIPAHKRSALAVDLIHSLWMLDFDFSQLEIVVCDDASTDETPQILRALAEQSPCPMKVIFNTRNCGPAGARNLAVQVARGEFLAFVDTDCRVDPQWLRRLLGSFEDNVAFVAGAILNKPEQKIVFFSRHRPGVAQEHPSYPTENIMYRHSIWKQFGGFDERLCFRNILGRPNECADVDLAWRILEAGFERRFCADAIVYHEVEPQKLKNWLAEPFRLFVVPALVRRHPRLRERMLYRRFFFYPGSIRFYVACLLLPVAFYFLHFWGVLAVALGFLLLRLLKRTLVDRKSSYSTAQWLLLLGRQLVMSSALIYGSIRFRCLVL